jgi:hypothetical protein
VETRQDPPPGRPRAAARGLAAAVARARPDLSPLRHSADFRRLYAGQAASFAGSMITYVAEPFQIYQLTHSSLMVGLLSVAELVPLVLAALLGGALIAAAGLRSAYLVDAGSCVVGLVMFARLRSFPPEPEADRPSLRGIAEGLRYVRGRPEILGTYLIDIAAMFFGAPFALFPAYAARVGGPAVLGLLYAAPGCGALLISATSGWSRHVHRHGRAIALAVCGWGLAIAAFGLAPGLWWGVAALAVAGGADMISGIFRMTMWNQTIPARLRGRLAGLEMISYTTGEPLGNLESGLAAAVTGSTRLAIVSGGVACVAGAVVVTAALPMLWRYDARTPSDEGLSHAGEPPEVPARPADLEL